LYFEPLGRAKDGPIQSAFEHGYAIQRSGKVLTDSGMAQWILYIDAKSTGIEKFPPHQGKRKHGNRAVMCSRIFPPSPLFPEDERWIIGAPVIRFSD
jgi:hypothetical protein